MPVRAEIGRFGQEMKRVPLQDGATTVKDLLVAANLNLAESEKVVDSESNTVNLTDEVEDGEAYYLIATYKSG